MPARAKEGACLEALVRMALPLFQSAERQCPRAGPGRPPEFPDWMLATLIMVAVLAKRKSKSAQYRYLSAHREELLRWLGRTQWPGRTTYFDRYRRVSRILSPAIRLQGQVALRAKVAEATAVAVDKSLIAARGPVGHPRPRYGENKRQGVDRDGGWGYSDHDGWVYGYGYEVVVTATPGSMVFPLLVSADAGNRSEGISFGEKIAQLPEMTRYVLADRGYDKNAYGDGIEYDGKGHRTGRHFLCPPIHRHVPLRHGRHRRCRSRQATYDRRQRRIAFYHSRRGHRLYSRRSRTVEPFNDWFKGLFELDQRVWHRGLDNNRTQILAAVFGYQLLVRWNYRHHRRNGQIKWILDTL